MFRYLCWFFSENFKKNVFFHFWTVKEKEKRLISQTTHHHHYNCFFEAKFTWVPSSWTEKTITINFDGDGHAVANVLCQNIALMWWCLSFLSSYFPHFLWCGGGELQNQRAESCSVCTALKETVKQWCLQGVFLMKEIRLDDWVVFAVWCFGGF